MVRGQSNRPVASSRPRDAARDGHARKSPRYHGGPERSGSRQPNKRRESERGRSRESRRRTGSRHRERSTSQQGRDRASSSTRTSDRGRSSDRRSDRHGRDRSSGRRGEPRSQSRSRSRSGAGGARRRPADSTASSSSSDFTDSSTDSDSDDRRSRGGRSHHRGRDGGRTRPTSGRSEGGRSRASSHHSGLSLAAASRRHRERGRSRGSERHRHEQRGRSRDSHRRRESAAIRRVSHGTESKRVPDRRHRDSRGRSRQSARRSKQRGRRGDSGSSSDDYLDDKEREWAHGLVAASARHEAVAAAAAALGTDAVSGDTKAAPGHRNAALGGSQPSAPHPSTNDAFALPLKDSDGIEEIQAAEAVGPTGSPKGGGVSPTPVADDDFSHGWRPPSEQKAKRRANRKKLFRGVAGLCEIELDDLREASLGLALYFESLVALSVSLVAMTVALIPVFLMAAEGSRLLKEDVDPIGFSRLTPGNIGPQSVGAVLNATIADPKVAEAIVTAEFLEVSTFPPDEIPFWAAGFDAAAGLVFALGILAFALRANYLSAATDFAHVTVGDYSVRVTGLPDDVTENELRAHFHKLFALDDSDWSFQGKCRSKKPRPPAETTVWVARQGGHVTSPATPVRYTTYNRDPRYSGSWVADVVITREDNGSLATFRRIERMAYRIREAKASVLKYSAGTLRNGGPDEKKRTAAKDRVARLNNQLLALAARHIEGEPLNSRVKRIATGWGSGSGQKPDTFIAPSVGPGASRTVAASASKVGLSFRLRSRLKGRTTSKVAPDHPEPPLLLVPKKGTDAHTEVRQAAVSSDAVGGTTMRAVDMSELTGPVDKHADEALADIDVDARSVEDPTEGFSPKGNYSSEVVGGDGITPLGAQEAERRRRRERVLAARKPVVAYVVFNNEESFRRCTHDYSRFTRRWQPEALRLRGKPLTVQPAPEPEDIIFENLEVKWWQAGSRTCCVLLLVLCVLAMAFCVVLMMQAAKVAATKLPANRVCSVDVPTALSGGKLTRAGLVRNYTADAMCDALLPGSTFLHIDAQAPVSAPVDGGSAAQVCSAPCAAASSGVFCAPAECGVDDCGSAPLEWEARDRLSCYCKETLTDAIERLGVFSGMAEAARNDGDICGSVAASYAAGWALAAGASFSVVVVNIVLRAVLTRLVKWERHKTLTAQAKALARMIFWSQLANTAVITVVVHARVEGASVDTGILGVTLLTGDFNDIEPKWYATVGLSLVIVLLASAVAPIAEVACRARCLSRCIRRCKQKSVATQSELDRLWRTPEFSLTARVSATLNVVFAAVAFSSALPLLLPGAAVILVVQFWVDKWALLRYSSAPLRQGRELADLMLESLPWALVLRCALGIWLYGVPEAPITGTDNLNATFPNLSNAIDSGLQFAGFSTELRRRPFQISVLPITGLMLLVLAAILLKHLLYGPLAVLRHSGACRRCSHIRDEGNPPLTEPFSKRVDDAGSYAEDAVHQAQGWRVVNDRQGGRWLLKVWTKSGVDLNGHHHGAGELKATFDVLRDAGVHSYRINDNPRYEAATHIETVILESYSEFVARVKRGDADDTLLGADRDAAAGAIVPRRESGNTTSPPLTARSARDAMSKKETEPTLL